MKNTTNLFFPQTIFKHLSLLFAPRARSIGELSDALQQQHQQQHIELCQSTLVLFLNVQRTLARDLNDATREVLLKVKTNMCGNFFLFFVFFFLIRFGKTI
jgi:hypothetical protein